MHPKTNAAFPTRVAGSNNYKFVVFQQPLPATDFERAEDMAADGIGQARRAIELLRELPGNLVKPFEPTLTILRRSVDKRRILNDSFRENAAAVLHRLEHTNANDQISSQIEVISRDLRDALDTSHRVTDLLEAERDIGWHRRIGRE